VIPIFSIQRLFIIGTVSLWVGARKFGPWYDAEQGS
jgi:hypothetical protein